MTPATKRRIVVSIPVLLTATACAINDQGWEMKPEAWPLPAIFIDASAAEIAQRCPPKPGFVTHGCAVRNFQQGICRIYVEPSVPKWLATHELAHCAGFNHI